MSFSYHFICGISYNSLKNDWYLFDKEEDSFVESKPMIPQKYIPYLSYQGNDLFYFFNTMMDDSSSTNGFIIVSKENKDKIPSFQDYYLQTSKHFNDYSHEFKQECRNKYYHLFMLFQYLSNKYNDPWFISYKY